MPKGQPGDQRRNKKLRASFLPCCEILLDGIEESLDEITLRIKCEVAGLFALCGLILEGCGIGERSSTRECIYRAKMLTGRPDWWSVAITFCG